MKQNHSCLPLLLICCIAGVCAQGADPWEDSLTYIIHTARNRNLPVEALEVKIREGRAKGRSAKEIHSVLQKRSSLLLQIKNNHDGSIPKHYIRELFNREQVLFPHSTRPTYDHRRKTGLKKNFHNNISQDEQSVEAVNNDETKVKKHKTNHTMQKRMKKKVQKAEVKSDRAVKRAQKRMEHAQKKMQKRAMKRRGQSK